MLRLSKFLWLAGLLPGAWGQQSYPFFSPSPSPPLLVTATANSPFGQSSYCYWVVVVYPIGKSTPSAPSCVPNAIETSSVLISWSAASGASSYDVLRTTTPILPNVTSNIAVATAVSGTTQTDSFGALSSYSISSAVPATANLYLDNTAFSTPQLRAIVTGVGGTTAFNLGSGGGGTPGGVNGQVQYNNAGAFGGFTVSGDGTLNTGTGVLTIGNGAITNAKLANSATTVNGQTCTLGSTCNANAGAAAHSVALNEGAGAALAAATIGTAGRLLIDQGAAADPSFNAVSGDGTITSAGVLTVTQVNGAAVPASAKLTSTNAGRQIVAAAAETAPITVSATGGIACATCATTTNGGALSATSPVTISAAGLIGCATCTTSAASLTSTDCVTGAGGQALQTPSANCTIDASGNLTANSLTVAAGASAGTVNTNGGNLFAAVTGDNTNFAMRWNGTGTTGVEFTTNSSSTSMVSVGVGFLRVTSNPTSGCPGANCPFSIANNGLFSTGSMEISSQGFRPFGQTINFLNTVGVCWNNSSSSFTTPGVGFDFDAAGVVGVQQCTVGTTAANYRDLKLRSLISGGTVPGISGCSAGTQVGGNTSGSFNSGTTGTCTVTLTFATTAPNAWECSANDTTTPGNLISQSGTLSATTCTVTGTTVSGDVLTFSARAY